MFYIKTPDFGRRSLVYYLAMEEYIAGNIKTMFEPSPDGKREVFFMWQVPPTVVFGRHQVMEAEANVHYCEKHGIKMFRRKSGGGCVYADGGNIMMSYITDSTDISKTFEYFVTSLAGRLSALGLNAEFSGRNDVLVNGKKVSGTAFFLLPDSGIVHGTLLFDSDFDAMYNAITPSDTKIRSKGIESVRQRVTNIKEELEKCGADEKYTDMEVFKNYIFESFCTGGCEERVLSGNDVKMIEEIEASYLDPEFLSGKNHSYTLEYDGRIPEVGDINLKIDMEKDVISGVSVSGDFFSLREDLDKMLSDCLKNRTCDENSIKEALKHEDISKYIRNMTNEDLLKIIFKH